LKRREGKKLNGPRDKLGLVRILESRMTESNHEQAIADKPRRRILPILLGFSVGFGIPFVCGMADGMYVAAQEQTYRVAHSIPEDAPRCGMGMMLPAILMFVIAPACSVLGAVTVWLDERNSN
jgi:hypothetical protein